MGANDKQVGGDHYKHPVQHWDWAQFIGYLEGNCTKYFGRHNTSKGKGIEDINKGLHYVQKMVEKDYPEFEFKYTLSFKADVGTNPDRDQTIKDDTI